LFLHTVAFACGGSALRARPQQTTNEPAPAVTKVEPPGWWVGLTAEVMLLLSGHDLEATHVGCNLPTLRVSRTQAAAGGNYLFIWMQIGAGTKSGTAVCRITAPKGATAFELPLAVRAPTLGKFQGLSQNDVMYLIMPDRFANGDPTNDEPAGSPGSQDRSKPRAYHGGDLLGIQNHLPYLKDLGVNTLWLTPIVKNGATEDYHGYGAVDLYAVDPHLGALQDYQNLVAAAHQQGMKIVFDVVPNHVGPKHPWLSNPPLPDWFHGTGQHHIDSFSPLKGSFYGKAGGQAVGNDLFESLIDPPGGHETKSHGRLVLGDSAGHEHGESPGPAISFAKQHLVGGNIRAGRLPRRHVSLCRAEVLGQLAYGIAQALSLSNYDRRSVSSRSECDFVFRRRSAALRRHR